MYWTYIQPCFKFSVNQAFCTALDQLLIGNSQSLNKCKSVSELLKYSLQLYLLYISFGDKQFSTYSLYNNCLTLVCSWIKSSVYNFVISNPKGINLLKYFGDWRQDISGFFSSNSLEPQ